MLDKTLAPLQVHHLTFHEFQELCKLRTEAKFCALVDPRWGLDKWALCLAGEVGELANKIKKVTAHDRGLGWSYANDTLANHREAILKECADIITYATLIVAALGEDTGQVVWDKFEEVNKRVGFDVSGSL